MRTTVTLDPDVVQGLRELQEAKSLTPKAAINEALRLGLRGLRSSTELPPAPFVIEAANLGPARFQKVSDMEAYLDELDWAESQGK